MKSVEIEQLKNDLELKVGILEMKINNGTINDSTSQDLIELHKEYKKEGTTLEELKLLYEDVQLALSN